MSLPSTWRQFQLFEFLPIRDPQYQSEAPLFSDPLLSAITSSQSYIAFSVQNAHIKLLSKLLLSLVRLFCGYEHDYRITFMRALQQSNLLVTLAEKQGSPALIKVWDLNKIMQLTEETTASDDTMKHKYVTQVLVHDGDNSYPVSCFLFNESLTCIAIGYTNGRVILVRGDLLRDRGLKQRLVYDSVDPITGVQFNRFEEILYVTTISKVLTVLITGRNQGKPHRVLSSNAGVDLGCSDLEYRSLKLIVANTDGFKYYNHVSKAHVINFSIPKRRILRLFKDYLLVVCPIEEGATAKSLTRLLVLDLHNMHISFSLTIPNLTVSHVFASSSDNNVFLLSTDGVLYKLHEKPINQQVEIVMQRDLFAIALNLANQYKLDNLTLLRINRLHAEYLYDKLDFDTSIAKYIDCLLLFAETATDENIDDFIINVITGFKEVSNIHNMTRFLSKLYDHRLADSDHLTLLLCCYCKLKMTPELDLFIDDLNLEDDGNKSRSDRLDLSRLNFPLIINLFKECGYYPQAIKLLFKLNHPHLIVDIQLNELHQHENCMSYIKSLPIDDLLRILIDFLKDLLDCMPMDTTELLINVFTGKYKPDLSHSLFEDTAEPAPVTEHPELAEGTVSSYSAFLSYLSGHSGNTSDTEAEPVETEPTYLPPRPSLVFLCFTNHLREFVVFLEACIETFDKYQGNISDKKDLLVTLFEIYLSMSVEEPSSKDEWVSKAKQLMQEHTLLLDKSSSLLISHIYDFKEGEILAKESAGGFEEALFRSAQISGDLSGAFQLVQKYGELRPELYKLMLKFVVSSRETFEQVTPKDFRYLLEKVKAHKLATPLEVIKILSSNDFATIGIIKDFLIEHIGQTNKEISNNLKLIQSYENESTKNSFKLTELTTRPMVIQNNKCSSCELKLDFPLIHFKCKHSYHQRCLNENTYIPETTNGSGTPKCPLCINELRSVLALRDNQLRSKENYELFESQLNDATDRFKVVSEYLGKGVMEMEVTE